MARISRLEDPDVVAQYAQMYVDGWERKEMAEHFNVHPDTITLWKKDPRVQAQVTIRTWERVNTVTRLVDREIKRRLGSTEERQILTVDELMKVRKEFLPQALQGRGHGPAEELDADLFDELDNPDKARELLEEAADRAK